MNIGFSFIDNPCIIGIRHLASIFPENIDIYSYYCDKNNDLFISKYHKSNLSSSRLSDDDDISLVNKFRTNLKTPYNWVKKKALPLANIITNEDNNTQLFDIFDEDNHLVLCLRIKSLHDNNNDLLCIVLQPELNIFGIDTASQKLTTENKKIIANILYKSVISVLNSSIKDKDYLKTFTGSTKKIISKGREHKQNLAELKASYQRNVLNTVEKYIAELSEEYSIDIVLSNDAIELIKNSNENPAYLKDIIKNAFIFAYNLNSESSQLIIIEEEYINISNKNKTYTDTNLNDTANKEKADGKFLSRKEKVELMLDQLENALKKVLSLKEKPTGQKIGAACSPSKSAAAITDYLKKHQELINEVLQENKSRWLLLKEHFRPLQNIIAYKYKPSNQKTA